MSIHPPIRSTLRDARRTSREDVTGERYASSIVVDEIRLSLENDGFNAEVSIDRYSQSIDRILIFKRLVRLDLNPIVVRVTPCAR